jgi:His-Xaa-Ser system radical SAM maturase HxsC
MAEEIKVTFKGVINGIKHDLFVGKVVERVNGSSDLMIKGANPNLVDSDISIILSESLLLNSQNGIGNVEGLDQIGEGDILLIHGNKIRNIFRPYSKHNSIFITGRCNSNCLMCSQPPMDYDDTLEFYKVWSYAITLMPNDIESIVITGGEPLLMGENLVKLINQLIEKNNRIFIDLLSNGRLQAKDSVIEMLEKVSSPSNVVFAVPMYSDYYQDHDHIVQAKDAFYQTILGVHKLSSIGFKIEIRVVLHKLSLDRLGELAEFIHLNFPFVYHVTFMGLEIIGYTKAHRKELILEDFNYQNQQLKKAILNLKPWNYRVSIYNLPFCYLDKELWEYSRQSISDWKNSFHNACNGCSKIKECAGFFSWNLDHMKPIPIHAEEITK